MSLEAAAWDRAGNVARATRAFRVDRVAPALAVGGVDATCPDTCTGTVVRAADGPLRVAGTATDGSGLASVHVRVLDDLGSDVASAIVSLDPEGAFTWDWDGWSAGVEPTWSGLEVLFAVPSGGGKNDLRYALTSDLAAWEGWAGPDPDLVASGALAAWSSTFGVSCLTRPLCDVTALFGDAGGGRYATRDPSRWSEPNLVKATGTGPGARGAGNAFLDDKVYYLDTRSASWSPPFYRAVTEASAGVGRVAGAEAWRPADQVYMATPLVLFTTAAGGGAEDLHLACPGITPWPKTTVALPAAAEVLAVAVSSSTAAVAVELAGGTVRFGTAANGAGSCLAAPAAPAWDPVTLGTAGREPSVALAADGVTAWRAWIRGPAGELVIAR